MRARRLAVLTSDSSHSCLVGVPATFAELLTVLEKTLALQKNQITVVHMKPTPVEVSDDASYQRALTDASETLTLHVHQKRRSRSTTEYILAFTSRQAVKVLNLEDDSISQWESRSLHWTGRVCVSGRDRLLFTGGSRRPKDVYQYDLTSGIESKLPGMNTGRMWHGVCALGSTVYAVGGRPSPTSQAQTSTEALAEGVWSLLPALNNPRESLTLVAQSGALYAFGGFDGMKRLSSIEKYEGQNWQLLACEMPAPRQMPGVIFTTDNSVLILGGQDDIAQKNEVFELALDEGIAQEKNPLPQADFFTGRGVVRRSGGALWAFGTHIYVLEAETWTVRS